MRILLTGDIHAGVKIDSSIFLKTFEDFFMMFLTKIVKEEEIEELYILGDLFENRNNINVKTSHLVYDVLQRFLEQFLDLKLNIVLGNHDIYFKNTRDINSVKNFELIKNIRVISETNSRILDDGTSIVEVPWLINTEEIDEFLKYKADLCLGHLEINGFEMVPGFIERKGLSDERLRNNFKQTFSGHFHLRKEMDRITYVGNPYPTKWTDAENTKGVYIFDTKTFRDKFIEFKESPQYVKIYFSLLKKKIQTLNKVKDNFVCLVIDDEITPKLLDKLSDLITKKKPISFSIIDKEMVYVSENEIDISCSSPIEYLIQYIEENRPEEDKKKLLKLIDTLYSEIKEY